MSSLTAKLDPDIRLSGCDRSRRTYPYLLVDAPMREGAVGRAGRGGGEPGRAGGVRHRRAGVTAKCWAAGLSSRSPSPAGRRVRRTEAARSQRGTSYVVLDDHAGMAKAIGRHFRGTAWQRCQVHLVRNALSLCGVAQRSLMLSLMRRVNEAPTWDAAKNAFAVAVTELRRRL